MGIIQEGDQGLQELLGLQRDSHRQATANAEIHEPPEPDVNEQTREAYEYAHWILSTLHVEEMLREVSEIWETGKAPDTEKAGYIDSDNLGSVEVSQFVEFKFNDAVKKGSQSEQIGTRTRTFGVAVYLEGGRDERHGEVIIVDANPLRKGEAEKVRMTQIQFTAQPLEGIAEVIRNAAIRSCTPQELPKQLEAQASERIAQFQRGIK